MKLRHNRCTKLTRFALDTKVLKSSTLFRFPSGRISEFNEIKLKQLKQASKRMFSSVGRRLLFLPSLLFFLAAPPTRCRLGVNVGVSVAKNWVSRRKEGEEPINNSQRRAAFLEKGTCTHSLARGHVDRRPKALLT